MFSFKNPIASASRSLNIRRHSISIGLPSAIVHYPPHYGAFHAFAKDVNEIPKLCLCAKGAASIAVTYIESGARKNYTDELIQAPLSSHFFPTVLAEWSLGNSNIEVLFEEKLCHRCNMIPPTLAYCHSMYGGLFKQTYGWYIHQTQMRYGVVSAREIVVPEQCPPEVKAMIESHKQSVDRRNSMVAEWEKSNGRFPSMPPSDELNQIDKNSRQLHHQIEKFFENETRQEFGFRKIGDAWVGETILAQLVAKVFPDDEVIRHYRPKWLEGLELDVFIPSKNLGFEYQGQQHYFPIKAWGGTKSLASVQERDAKKRILCGQAGVKLLEIRFSEPLTLDYIANRIQTT